MLISTIIPVYNASNTLDRCIESLISAQVENLSNEIILVNDGSVDNSLEICLNFESKYSNIKVFSQDNQGPSAARNNGLDVATGEYITFVDSDDYVSQDYFSVIFENISYEIDILIFGYYKKSEGQIKYHSTYDQLLDEGDILQLISRSSKNSNLFWFPFTKVYRKKVLRELTFDNEVTLGEDTLFNIEAFINSRKIRIINKAIYFYVDTPDSLTQIKYKPHLLKNMLAHYNKRCVIHEKYEKIQGELFNRDISIYYVNHILLWIFRNMKNSPDKSSLIHELSSARDSIIYKNCFKNYSYNWTRPKLSIYIKLFELRFYRLLMILM